MSSPTPDISRYLELIDSFLSETMAAAAFQRAFLTEMKCERRILGDPAYPILQELFENADAYVEYPDLRENPDDLDDDQLRICAQPAQKALRSNGFV